jgi:hypothetical protein
MKGSSFITFIVMASLSFIFFSFIAFVAYKYSENAKISLKEQAARQVAFEIISEVSNIYQQGSKIDMLPTESSVVLLETILDLPEKIADETYYIEAVYSPGLVNYIKINESLKEEHGNSKIAIVFEKEKYYFDLPGIPLVFQGKTSSEEVKVRYVRYRIGEEVRDTIIIGDQPSVIDLNILQ